MKVAIVCDWLVGTGGAERVVLELHRMYPDAPIYTSQYDSSQTKWFGESWFEDADIRTLWLQRLPKFLRKAAPPLRALAFSRLNLSSYDLVISSSGAEAKFVKKLKSTAVHITYCHAPTHYYWARYDQYLAEPGFGWLNPLAKIGLKILVGPMRRWDRKASQRPDFFVANSKHTASEIEKYYDRKSEVIHPPVDVERFTHYNQPGEKRHAFITAGRQAPYKKTELAVEAANHSGLPLLVIGRGPQHRALKKLAKANVTFLRDVNDEQLAEYFGSAKGFIFPGVEDFGIVAVEAMAAGTPVLAYEGGGALDYVNSDTGMLFHETKPDKLGEILLKFASKNYDYTKIAQRAQAYSSRHFREKMLKFVKLSVK